MSIAIDPLRTAGETRLFINLFRIAHSPRQISASSESPVVALVRTHQLRRDDRDLYHYQLIETTRVNDTFRQQVLANLGEFNDLGEVSALEIALGDAKTRLEAEESHQHFQEKEFERGWYRSGCLFNRTRRYTQRYMREQRAKTAKHIEQIKAQILELERVVANYPTPPDILKALREQYEETRLEAARKFQEWEAELINGMVQKE